MPELQSRSHRQPVDIAMSLYELLPRGLTVVRNL